MKVVDLLQSKTLKSGTPPVRACVTALCIILDVTPEKLGKGQDKVIKLNKLRLENVDYWTPGKRMLMDAGFLERLLLCNTDEVHVDRIRLIQDDIISAGDWDIFQAGKAFPPAETLCQWISCLCSFRLKKMARLMSLKLLMTRSLRTELLLSNCRTYQPLWKGLKLATTS